ncbi:uncharacterized protein LOC129598207 [Paramacrobiotus metropolitanus]|uniref:uncharacterized protein LOC129598207 n=1 Tax=Paramacrobiotus metropolitanus TaxID=2943436 RepID=UPI002445E92B|nr:uncharacterized protein LOC129598207 [Paramacrobiotus metropolitanus]
MASRESTEEIELFCRIFNGVHGSVDKGLLTNSNECVVVKHIRLSIHQPQRELQIQRLKANFDFTATLQHRNLVREIHHQECEHDKDLAINLEPWRYEVIMEFVAGENLHDFSSTNVITAPQLQDIVVQMVAGLDYLHAHRYAHRDLRGANIMISINAQGDPHIQFTGMGHVAVALDRPSGAQRERGAWLFLAPERITGECILDESGEVALRGDMWSLGCVVLEVINGGWPEFCQEDGDGERRLLTDDVKVLLFVGNGGVPTVSALLPTEIQDFVGKCLCRNPRERCMTKELKMNAFLNCCKDTVSQWDLPQRVRQEADPFLYRNCSRFRR